MARRNSVEDMNKLIKLAQTGDKKSTDEVVLGYLPLVKRIAVTEAYRSITIDEETLEDRVHNGILGIYRALETFDDSKANFATYVQNWIRYFMFKRASIFAPTEVLEYSEGTHSASIDIEAEYIAEEERKRVGKLLLDSGLLAQLTLINLRLMNGLNLTEAAKVMGVTRQRTSQIESAYIKWLNKTIKQEDLWN